MLEKYRAKKEIKKRIEEIPYIEDKTRYLRRMVGKKNLLSPTTRDALYSELGDLYLEGPLSNSAIIEAIRAYASAGQIRKARSLINRGWNLTSGRYRLVRYTTLDAIMGPKEYDELCSFIDRAEKKKKRRREGSLEKKSTAAILIIGVIGGIFFLSSNITGNVIGNMTNSTSNTIGVISLVIGLVAGYFYFKNRN